jgi:hypothetical protein
MNREQLRYEREKQRQKRKRVVRVSFALSVLLFFLSLFVGFFGQEYELSKIPPEIRANMTNTDWIGTEWIMLAIIMFAVSVFLALLGLLLWVFTVRKKRHRR